MTDNIEILTKVYGFVNRIKVCLAFKDIAGIWKVVNELSDYLVSVDCAPTQLAADDAVCSACGEPMKYHVGGAKRGLCKNRIAAKA